MGSPGLRNKKIHTFRPLKRFFYIVFAVYLFLLAVTPCGDKQDCDGEKKGHLCESSHAQGREAPEEEDCTPLCSCSCCAAVFMLTETSSFDTQRTEINTLYALQGVSPETGVISPVWQPPRFS
jgi:hypothetical protein